VPIICHRYGAAVDPAPTNPSVVDEAVLAVLG